MLTWLSNDLAQNTKLWTVAFWHHPPYSKGSHDSDVETELVQMRANALPILEATGLPYDNQYCWVYEVRDGRIVELLLFAGLCYFVICFGASVLVKRLQKKVTQ